MSFHVPDSEKYNPVSNVLKNTSGIRQEGQLKSGSCMPISKVWFQKAGDGSGRNLLRQ